MTSFGDLTRVSGDRSEIGFAGLDTHQVRTAFWSRLFLSAITLVRSGGPFNPHSRVLLLSMLQLVIRGHHR